MPRGRSTHDKGQKKLEWLVLVGTDITHSCAINIAVLRPVDPSLIGPRATSIRAGVDRQAAREQRMGSRVSTIPCKCSQQGVKTTHIACPAQGTGVVIVDIVAPRCDGVRAVHTSRIREEQGVFNCRRP